MALWGGQLKAITVNQYFCTAQNSGPAPLNRLDLQGMTEAAWNIWNNLSSIHAWMLLEWHGSFKFQLCDMLEKSYKRQWLYVSVGETNALHDRSLNMLEKRYKGFDVRVLESWWLDGMVEVQWLVGWHVCQENCFVNRVEGKYQQKPKVQLWKSKLFHLNQPWQEKRQMLDWCAKINL